MRKITNAQMKQFQYINIHNGYFVDEINFNYVLLNPNNDTKQIIWDCHCGPGQQKHQIQNTALTEEMMKEHNRIMEKSKCNERKNNNVNDTKSVASNRPSLNLDPFGMDKPKSTSQSSKELKDFEQIHFINHKRVWKSIRFDLKKGNLIRFNGRSILLFIHITIKQKQIYMKMEISPMALTDLCVTTNIKLNKICLMMRYIAVSKFEKKNRNNQWITLTASELEHVKIFKQFAIWKYEGSWEESFVKCLINRNEYTANASTKRSILLATSVKVEDNEMKLRELEWNKEKKPILQDHSIIMKNIKNTRENYLSGKLKSKCWECRHPRDWGKWDVMCIDKKYLNVNENNEITYNLLENNWDLEPLTYDPKYDPIYKYNDKQRGAMILQIRMDIWYELSHRRSRFHVVGDACQFLSLSRCCEIILKSKNEVQSNYGIMLSLNDICDHLWYLICIFKGDAKKNVYLRKKIPEHKILNMSRFTWAISKQCLIGC